MRTSRIAMLLTIALAAALGVFMLTGCAEDAEDAADDAAEDAVSEEPGSAILAEPGLYESADDLSQAFGVLAFEDLEGGFWVIKDAHEGEDVEGAENVVVISNAQDLDADLDALEGEYVMAEGTTIEGVSIRMAGPEMEAERLVDATGLEPPVR